MVVSRARVLGSCCVAVWSAVACASPPPQPRSADLIVPEWISDSEPPAPAKSKETTRLVQKPGLIYGDPAKERVPAERKAKSPFLPNSANSRFYGGLDCIDSPGHKCR
jgi:hypothetical protein